MNAALERLIQRLPNVRLCGKGQYQATCPAHDDQHASLSIAEGDNRRVLVHCHAGCSVEAVCEAIGLRLADLMSGSSSPSASTKPRKSAGKSGCCRDSKGRRYPTADAAVAFLTAKLGAPSMTWPYHDAQGGVVGIVVRWDRPDGKKDIRPVSRHADGWRTAGMPEPRPLYRLPELRDATRVYITEGEKACDAARSIGLVATCSAHGADSAAKTDWQPLAGKECVILPDNDPAGQKYAHQVERILLSLKPAATVKIVALPGLPAKGDMFDFVASRN